MKDQSDAGDLLIRFGNFELDTLAGEIRKAGRRLKLAPQPWRILVYLARRPGRLVTRDELIDHVWGAEVSVDYDAGLGTAMRRIRAALGDSHASPRYIETVPRLGYRFVAPVHDLPGAPAAPAARSAGRSGPRGARPALRRALLGLAAAMAILVALLSVDAFRQVSAPANARSLTATRDPAAVEAFHKGRFILEHGDPGEAGRAVPFLRKALEIEPAFPGARVALARALQADLSREYGSRMEAARREIELAVRLEEAPAEAWALRGRLRWVLDRDWSGARLDYREALAREPGRSSFHQELAQILSGLGEHDRAVEEVETARRLDPLSPMINLDAGWIYFYARRFREALAQAERAAELDPSRVSPLVLAGYAAASLGDRETALRHFREAMASAGAGEEVVRAAKEAGRPGAPDPLTRWWTREEQIRSRALPAYDHALIKLRSGEVGDALDLLAESVERMEWSSRMMAVDPRLDSLRDNPGFEALLRRINRAG